MGFSKSLGGIFHNPWWRFPASPPVATYRAKSNLKSLLLKKAWHMIKVQLYNHMFEVRKHCENKIKDVLPFLVLHRGHSWSFVFLIIFSSQNIQHYLYIYQGLIVVWEVLHWMVYVINYKRYFIFLSFYITPLKYFMCVLHNMSS